MTTPTNDRSLQTPNEAIAALIRRVKALEGRARTAPHLLYGPMHSDVDSAAPLGQGELLAFDGSKLAPDTRMHWRGEWQPTTYYQDDVVTDGDWLAVALTTTTDRAAPEAVGDPSWALLSDPSGWSSTFDTDDVTWTTELIIGAAAGWLFGVRAYTRDPLATEVYVFVNNVLVFTSTYVAGAEGWATVAIPPIIVGPGDELEVQCRQTNASGNRRINYRNDSGHWAGGPPSWASAVQGGLDTGSGFVYSDTGYGIDVAFQEGTVSPDWDFMSSYGGGGGSGGDGGAHDHDVAYLRLDGSNAMGAPLDFGSQKGTNLADPVDPQDAMTLNHFTLNGVLQTHDHSGGAQGAAVPHGNLSAVGLNDHHDRDHGDQHHAGAQDPIDIGKVAAPSQPVPGFPPAVSTDLATKQYVDDNVGGGGPHDHDTVYLRLDGSNVMAGDLQMGGARIVSLGDATAGSHALSRSYADGRYSATGHGHTNVPHGDLTGVSANQHHSEDHRARHYSGGADALDLGSMAAPSSPVPGFPPAADLDLATKAYVDAQGGGGVSDHDLLTNVTPDQHHARDHADQHQAGGLDPLDIGKVQSPTQPVPGFPPAVATDLTTKAYVDALPIPSDHGDLGGVTADQHHAEDHQSRHYAGGADALDLASMKAPSGPVLGATPISGQHLTTKQYVDAAFLRLDGTTPMAGNLNMGGHAILGATTVRVTDNLRLYDGASADYARLYLTGDVVVFGHQEVAGPTLRQGWSWEGPGAPNPGTHRLYGPNNDVVATYDPATDSWQWLTKRMTQVADPVNPQDLATKAYVDGLAGPALAAWAYIGGVNVPRNVLTNIPVTTVIADSPGWLEAGWTYQWNYRTQTNANPPAGSFHRNNAAWASVTTLHFNVLDNGGTDREADLLDMGVGRRIDLTDGPDRKSFDVTGAPSSTGTVVSVPVSFISEAGSDPAANTVMDVAYAGGGGASQLVVPGASVPGWYAAWCKFHLGDGADSEGVRNLYLRAQSSGGSMTALEQITINGTTRDTRMGASGMFYAAHDAVVDVAFESTHQAGQEYQVNPALAWVGALYVGPDLNGTIVAVW